jgi:hypothetical protein
MSEKMRLAG